MYVENEFVGDIDQQGPHADCPSSGPEGMFHCTRSAGHTGVHRAGINDRRWVAEWDDDRSTDNGPDFFAELGL